MVSFKQIAVLVLAHVLVTGCAHKTFMAETDREHAKNEELVRQKRAEISSSQERPLVTHSVISWVGRKAVEVSRESALPPVFSKEVTLIFPGRVNLRTAAERINKVTNIPVRLKPDVFIPISQFVGGNSNAGAGGAASPVPVTTPLNGPNGLPPLPALPSPLANSMFSQVANTNDEIEINYTGPLAGLLNQISSRFGINWEYSTENGISFSRLVTKVFTVKANPGDSSFTASLGKGGSGSAVSAYSSDGQVKMNSTFSVWDGITKSLESIRSAVGKFNVSQATGTVTVTDTREVVELAQKIIDNENTMLTRQVAIRLDMYSVQATDDIESGLNWNMVYQKFSDGVANWGIKFATPSALTSELAGGVGLAVIGSATNSGIQSLSGTEALIKVLQGFGKVSRVQSVSAMTLNRQPVPIGVTSQVSYLAKTTPGSSTTGTTTLPGLEPGQVTTGFLTNLLPTVLDSNSILLQFSIDMSELRKMGIISTGAGSTLQSIQTPEVDAVQFVQRVALRPGNTLVLTGYERDSNSYEQRGLTRDIGLGGSVVGARKRESIVIMLTPNLVDGAN